MRNLLLATGLTLLASACDSGPGAIVDPPILKITSPARSLIQNGAGKIKVTGTVAPNPRTAAAIQKVSVNNVVGVVQPDGSFSIEVQVPAGATLLHTEAIDADGGKATDTRSVEAGELRAPGSNVENAVTMALSKQAFAKIAGAAGPIIKGMNLQPMLAPMNPMVHSGDENGPDCLYGQLYVDNVTMTNAIITLVPVDGGLSFSAEIDGLDVRGHMNYAVACLSGSNTTDVKASKVVVAGTLDVTPDGNNGFKTDLVNPTVTLQGLNISASGVPGAILSIVPLDSAIQYILPKVAGLVMGPLMNQALGALAGPKSLNVAGKMLTVEVSPTDITFTSAAGLITLDMKMIIDGAQGSKGYIFTDNGMPAMNPGNGMQLGIADDLANEMLSQFVALGALNMSMPQNGGTFDTAKLEMTSPPMISADPADGKMRLILPDVMTTFTLQGTPVGKAALNAKIDVKIAPANSGFGIALQLGTPEIFVDVLDDIANETRLTNDELSTAVQLGLDNQIAAMGQLLTGIPLPAMAGLQMKNLSIGADVGYVMVQGELQ